MKKEAQKKKASRKAIAYWQIYLMISMSIALAFVIGESDRVSGQAAGQAPPEALRDLPATYSLADLSTYAMPFAVDSNGNTLFWDGSQWGNPGKLSTATTSGTLAPTTAGAPPREAAAPFGSLASKKFDDGSTLQTKIQEAIKTGGINNVGSLINSQSSQSKDEYKKVGISSITPIIVNGKDEVKVIGTDDSVSVFDANGQPIPGQSRAGYTGQLGVPGLGAIQVKGLVLGHLAEGLSWGIAVAGLVKLVGPMVGLTDKTANALSVSLGAGIISGKLVYGILGKTKASTTQRNLLSLGTGLAVAFIIFAMMYKKENQKIVRFECLPWEPPIGGSSCEQCNNDKFKPCSEYRCKSLGQACQLLNKGTTEETCAWVNPKDTTSPTITPSTEALKPTDLRYITDTSIRPPALGVKIVKGAGTAGCLQAFTPLEFGIVTNEPAQCKIDYDHKPKFDDMAYYFGESNFFEYNHTEKMKLPSASSESGAPVGNESSGFVSGAPVLRNDGSFSLYVRCKDANGNENVDEYSINFCVDQGPDTTPPVIVNTSIPSGGYVQYNVNNVPIEVYVNEPAECKWSRNDKAYDDMENTMDCLTGSYQINADLAYVCTGNLTGIKNSESNTFYFRCKDKPFAAENDRNVNAQSYALILKGSQPLNIISVKPNETITGSTDTVPVDLEVETSAGAEEGKAFCYFSASGASESYLEMFETNSYQHKQTLDLTSGDYTYYIKCVDAGGNIAQNDTSFSVNTDRSAPDVTRVYREGTDSLKVVTNEDAECTYSLQDCNFNIDEGLKLIYSNSNIKNNHFVQWKPGVTYYIKCKDSYGNAPDPDKCSVIVSATEFTK